MAYKLKKSTRTKWNKKYPSYVINREEKFIYRMGYVDGEINQLVKSRKEIK